MQTIVDKLIRKYRTFCPFQIAKGLGIKIIFEDLGESTKGIFYTKFRQKYIVINNQLSHEWQRLICAHELGHNILHAGTNRFFIDDHTFLISGKYERQANIFAVMLLTSIGTIEQGESISSYFSRIEVPKEMVIYYKGAFN
ncbi:Zn-dependent peptidase ImmA (M78 family) [Paenibacillus sp. PastF-3]|uniref:ImmA/IrrE family metallo-endopeptidase n=1 Tax=unclassified Paenibacillus TaxID=185978 RepID=UPI0024752D59|nr:ImmA/IrrE family metallo-endopeptidase [Paenibacillus sp. PastF-3]MDH6371808.1 Zn-dependent peptidase ImmA (M78 family) [Paenibacillus sp. PastF-3]